ncbi:hypothetical protein H0H92_002056 [Tricholoma furcatifolium]|nr:hypothetical protein H0H92_002056 [Tricholoma furcatifolium]
MVHRPSDSRLLNNLLNHEKDYAKSVLGLVSPSNALGAYAAASAPPVSDVLLRVSTALASADEALKRYADRVEAYREQLKMIKQLEEDVATVVRDREILVTRLIKASKASKNHKSTPSQRESMLLSHGITPSNHSPAASTVSLSSAFSSPSALGVAAPAPGSKLSNAQAELQACEATLAARERELYTGRTELLREGLGARCHAMVECGWLWGEVGKKALKALEVLERHQGPSYGRDVFKLTARFREARVRRVGRYRAGQKKSSYAEDSDSRPLPPPQSPPPDAKYYIPPAHAISDSDSRSFSPLHFASASTPIPTPRFTHPHVLERRITEEDLARREEDEAGGSSADEAERARAGGGQDAEKNMRVVENPRFMAPEKEKKRSPLKGHLHLHHEKQRVEQAEVERQEQQPMSTPPRKSGILGRRGSTSSSAYHSTPPGPSRARAPGTGTATPSPEKKDGFFGSIRGLFGGSTVSVDSGGESSPTKTKTKTKGGIFGRRGTHKRSETAAGTGWHMRTERNLRELERDAARAQPAMGLQFSEGEAGGPGGGAYAHMRNSVSGRGRVVSDAAVRPSSMFGPEAGAGVDFGGGPAAPSGQLVRRPSESGSSIVAGPPPPPPAAGGAGAGAGAGGRARKLKKPMTPGPTRTPSTSSTAKNVEKEKRKEKKKGRSSSVPPVPTTVLTTDATSPGASAGVGAGSPVNTAAPMAMAMAPIQSGVSPLFAGTEIEARHLASLVPRDREGMPTATATTTAGPAPAPASPVKRQRSVRKPPPSVRPGNGNENGVGTSSKAEGQGQGQQQQLEGVHHVRDDGWTYTVVGSANPHTNEMLARRGSASPSPAPGPSSLAASPAKPNANANANANGNGIANAPGVKRHSSVRSSASAPPGSAVLRGHHGKGKGRAGSADLRPQAMGSLMGAVGASAGASGSGYASGSQRNAAPRSQVSGTGGGIGAGAGSGLNPALPPGQAQFVQVSIPTPAPTLAPVSTVNSTSTVVQPASRNLEMQVPKAPPRVGEALRRGDGVGGAGGGGGGVVQMSWGDVRAPGSVFDQLNGNGDGGASGSASGSGLGPAFVPRAAGGAGTGGVVFANGSVAAAGSVGADSAQRGRGRASPSSSAGTCEERKSRPAKSPLRSALKTPSPTPSPMRTPVLNPQNPPTNVSAPADDRNGVQADDNASSDSGDEVFFEADDELRDAPVQGLGTPAYSNPHENQSGVSIEGLPDPGPRRRKSVRVSLNPTFSATPPAIEYYGAEDEEEEEGVSGLPWTSSGAGVAGMGAGSGAGAGAGAGLRPGWASEGPMPGPNGGTARAFGVDGDAMVWGRGREKETLDMWEDSSEEDEEYTKAKSLLSRLAHPGRKDKAKGKAGSKLEDLNVSTCATHGPPVSHAPEQEMSDDEQRNAPHDEVKSEDANAPINIKVVSSTGEEVFFKIKRSTKLSKLQGAYANKVGKDVNSIRFLYDGSRISEDDTPNSLEMEDNDTIDVMVERRFTSCLDLIQ